MLVNSICLTITKAGETPKGTQAIRRGDLCYYGETNSPWGVMTTNDFITPLA
jgi:hypothetical protein